MKHLNRKFKGITGARPQSGLLKNQNETTFSDSSTNSISSFIVDIGHILLPSLSRDTRHVPQA